MNPEMPTTEEAELLPGKYRVRVNFKLRNGEDYSLPFDRPVSLDKNETLEDLKKKALSAACAVGLHNFGMDIYFGRYPNGHPVKFVLQHDSGKEIEFSQNFDANGYPVSEK